MRFFSFYFILYHNAQIDSNLSILSCVLLFDNKGVTKQLIARYCLHYMIFNLIRRGGLYIMKLSHNTITCSLCNKLFFYNIFIQGLKTSGNYKCTCSFTCQNVTILGCSLTLNCRHFSHTQINVWKAV